MLIALVRARGAGDLNAKGRIRLLAEGVLSGLGGYGCRPSLSSGDFCR